MEFWRLFLDNLLGITLIGFEEVNAFAEVDIEFFALGECTFADLLTSHIGLW